MTTGPDSNTADERPGQPEAAGTGTTGPRPRVIRYGAMGYVGEFADKPGLVIGCGRKVVVQTERGIELGEPLGIPCSDGACELRVPRRPLDTYVTNSGTEFCQPRAGRILRVATDADVSEHRHLNAHVVEDIEQCSGLIEELGLDMKIITAEHLLGGERIIFYFRSPSRVDFRQLVKNLAHRYRTRIEMRQVGARDEARLVADYEVCGRECCCRGFLKKLRPVNMKMAKLQKSTLDPSKVSGRCGRLRCCLRYEHCGYEELAKHLPRVGSRVRIDAGPATVLDRQVLTQLVLLRTDDHQQVAVPLDEIREFNLPPAPPQPAQSAAPAPRSPAARAAVETPTPQESVRPEPEQPGERRRRPRRRGRGRPAELARPGEERAETSPPAVGPETPVGDAPGTRFVAEPPPAVEAPDTTSRTEVPPGPPLPAADATARERPDATGRRRRRGRRRRARRAHDRPGPDAGPDSGGDPAS
ncbi:MAG: regulatory iron-sulfur-containing complex subunit RicT [Planctomycetota bacterium]